MKYLWSADDINYLINNYNIKTKDELCADLNRTWSAIKNQLFKLKLKRNIGLINLRQSNLDILLNDTNETYYWLGFLAADGHFNIKSGRLKFWIDKKDELQLLKYADYIKCHNIQYYKNMCGINAQNKDVVKILASKFSISSTKTYNPMNISVISNDDLMFSFIIGFIDGDGHIRVLKRKNCNINIDLHMHGSWLDNLIIIENFIFRYFNYPKNRIYSRITKAGSSKLIFSNSSIIKDIYQKALELDLPILNRKWDNIKNNLFKQ